MFNLQRTIIGRLIDTLPPKSSKTWCLFEGQNGTKLSSSDSLESLLDRKIIAQGTTLILLEASDTNQGKIDASKYV